MESLAGREKRSVAHSDILPERPATLAIILMARPIGIGGMLKGPKRTRTGPTVRVNGIQTNAAVAEASSSPLK
jgi:hypothetical protein